jgi:hypothetical protein
MRTPAARAHEEASMPDLRIKDIHLPELHLPEMSRDDIVQAVGDARRDFDLSRFDPRRIDLSEVEAPKVDVPKAIADAAQAAGLVRSKSRPRLPFIVGGLITVGLVGLAVMNSPMIRTRLSEFAQRAKQRIEERRAARLGTDLEPRAFDAAVAVPVESSAYADQAPAASTFDGPADLPAGLGADVYRDSPVEEHART